MATRYYLYPVHTSLTFLHTPSLAAALYLILARFLARDYASAAAVAATCTVDVPFTAEEKWLFAKLARAQRDDHPDAHAVRLKVGQEIRWPREPLAYSRTPTPCASRWEIRLLRAVGPLPTPTPIVMVDLRDPSAF